MGQAQVVRDVVAEKKQTRPPRRLTDATLLTAMETAGRTIDDKELSQAMKDCGLGTPSTRASMIETLLAREYIVREGKALAADRDPPARRRQYARSVTSSRSASIT